MILKKIKNYIKKSSQNSAILRGLIDKYKTIRLLKYYKYSPCRKVASTNDNLIIVLVDGRTAHGGMSDRICGIISAYKYAKETNRPFKIYYNYPYKLQEFLLPNKYNWIVESDLSYNYPSSFPKYISQFGSNKLKADAYFKKLMKRANKGILHLYTNAHYFKRDEFCELYNELFRPSAILRNSINKCLDTYGTYYSITFRFQQLLGDFKEPGFETLSAEQSAVLIDKCLKTIEYVHSLDIGKKLLVTSDSITFLNIAKKTYDYVLTNPGKIVHMDFVRKDEDIDLGIHMNSFIDFYTLAYAEKIFLIKISPLYSSTFPSMASMVFNRPYFEIIENEGCFKIKD